MDAEQIKRLLWLEKCKEEERYKTPARDWYITGYIDLKGNEVEADDPDAVPTWASCER